MREQVYRPLLFDELTLALGIEQTKEALTKFKELLSQMESVGAIVRTRTNRYGVPERMDLVVGHLRAHARGFGFVVPIDRTLPDFYISAGDLHEAMDGDRVIVRPLKQTAEGKREGEVIRVVNRAHKTVVGVLSTFRTYGFVKPDDRHLTQDIFIPGDQLFGAVDGQKVVVEITAYPGVHQSATAKVIEVLGFPNDPGVDILSVVRKYGLPEAFPADVLQAAEVISHEVTKEELAQRKDLRGESIVTIDGPDAKDLDDAVHVRRLANGNYLLGVHIADVSYYVREGSALDREAFRRGTSVYLVDRVIPMLPPRLSNGICSLHPQVDRLTITCEMEWSPAFELVRHDIYPSVIRTKERMTYQAVRDIVMEQDASLLERYAELVPMFHLMAEFAMGLRERRMKRGAIDFGFAETKIKVDEQGHPLELIKRERSIAEMIIEEFMLAANETIAEHFFWMEVPFLYRVHEAPEVEKMIALNEFVHNFGYHLKAVGNIHPRALQDLLEHVRGRAEETVISHVLLRQMKQARYAAQSLGHFGLAAQHYTHFTSPIRRYPDLMIHRVLREVLVEGGLAPERYVYLQAIMPEVAEQSSRAERTAVDAERETDLLKKIEYMQDKIGEEFEGMISGVTGFGMFVQLDNSVEGLIHVSYLEDDYYHYHEKLHALIGERLKRVFRIGDRVRIRVVKASKENLAIDFALVAKLQAEDVEADVEARQSIPVKSKNKGRKGSDEYNFTRDGRTKMPREAAAPKASQGRNRRKKRDETASAVTNGSLLPVKGGYGSASLVQDVRPRHKSGKKATSEVAKKSSEDSFQAREAARQRKKKERQLLNEVSSTYGVRVKDKGNKRAKHKSD
ncbi:ribonuclease R [Sulfoacidibacillus thermotolerans]|uniref:Ribonuclease R n=2 Tax=Sulfoacidibacillus thermotolerans TaxID=1765684 RepID=A0A2U3D9D7_SULT2|nr:ribonuclease R [Sulfoacidibacillus thermotolerans]